MGSFVVTTGKRIRDEGSVKERIKNSVNGMMEQSVSDWRLVDVSGFGVVDSEGFIAAVIVGTIFKFLMKFNNVIHQIQLEFLDVSFLPLTS